MGARWIASPYARKHGIRDEDAKAAARSVLAGGPLFLASETFLSIVIFMPAVVTNWGFLMAMLTYNGGQLLFAVGSVIAILSLAARSRGAHASVPSTRVSSTTI